jgi:hypothetical protein
MNIQQKCFYDGISLFIKDPRIFEHCVRNANRYGLIGNFDVETDIDLLTFKGRFKNFDISTAETKSSKGLLIGGSIHKYVHGSNHGQFLWSEFLEAHKIIQEEFQFDGSLVDFWILECGFNLELPDNWAYPTKEIPKNTIYVRGEPMKSTKTRYARGAFGIELLKGGCKEKSYDKGTQKNLTFKVLRDECSCKKLALQRLGFRVYDDLIDLGKHLKYANHVVKAFSNLIMVQHEIFDNPNLPATDRMFLREYNNNKAWVDLRKKSDYQFKIARKRHIKLVDTYCPVNYQREIHTLMMKELQ